jgi:Flp pilus assembly protein TadB
MSPTKYGPDQSPKPRRRAGASQAVGPAWRRLIISGVSVVVAVVSWIVFGPLVAVIDGILAAGLLWIFWPRSNKRA